VNPVVLEALVSLNEDGHRRVEANAYFGHALCCLQGNPATLAAAPKDLIPKDQRYSGLITVRLLHAADNFSFGCAPALLHVWM
jgi:hypothetical protein